MTEQELDQHRADLNQLDIEQLRCGVMLQLRTIETLQYEVDAIPGIKAERDAWKRAHDEQVAKLIEIANERDALKDAARLALDALEATYQLDSKTLPPSVSFSDVYNRQLSARTALRKVVAQ